MFYRFMTLIMAFTAATFFTGSAISSPSDDSLVLAARQYSERDFTAAYLTAEKSADKNKRTFLRGMSAFRLEKYDEAIQLLAEGGQKLPLLADYALFYEVQAHHKKKQYPAALAKLAPIGILFPNSKLLRRSEKLFADIQYDSGDYKSAQRSYKSFIEKYPTGRDLIDAVYQSGRCEEELANFADSLQVYRSIWLNNPASLQAAKAQERIRLLVLAGHKIAPYSVAELLKRATTLQNNRQNKASLHTLEMIHETSLPPIMANKIDLCAGISNYRLKRYAQAEKLFRSASDCTLKDVSSESRLWLARSLARQNLKDRAFAIYMDLAREGKKQQFAVDSLMEAADLKRGESMYAEAAQLFEQGAKISTSSKTVAKALWCGGWCRYLAADYTAAVNSFNSLLSNENYREKVLYWMGRGFEKSGNPKIAASYFSMLINEFPAGFYATWYREQHGVKDLRETLGNRDPLMGIPKATGFDKPRLLASLGMLEDARIEMAALRKKIDQKKKGEFSSVARVYLEMRDYGMAMYMFKQNRPLLWSSDTLPLWTIGYPRAYSEVISHNASKNGLSEGLIYAFIRSESSFSPSARSSAGAIGLMQLMPATARQTSGEKGEFNPKRLTVPEYNIKLGTKHLHDLMKQYDGDVIFMAAAYNAGSGALNRWKKNYSGMSKDEFIESIPYNETREYVKKVYASAATYRQLYALN